MTTLENTMDGIHRQAKEEQQLKDANFALTEANKVLKRENPLKTPAFDGREGAGIKEKIQEPEGDREESVGNKVGERADESKSSSWPSLLRTQSRP